METAFALSSMELNLGQEFGEGKYNGMSKVSLTSNKGQKRVAIQQRGQKF
jgi:hypothetical protein